MAHVRQKLILEFADAFQFDIGQAQVFFALAQILFNLLAQRLCRSCLGYIGADANYTLGLSIRSIEDGGQAVDVALALAGRQQAKIRGDGCLAVHRTKDRRL